MSDRYKITSDSDGNVYIEKDYGPYTRVSPEIELASAPPDAATVASKQCWMNVSGVDRYRHDIYDVYSTVLEKLDHAPNKDYTNIDSFSSYRRSSSYYLHNNDDHLSMFDWLIVIVVFVLIPSIEALIVFSAFHHLFDGPTFTAFITMSSIGAIIGSVSLIAACAVYRNYHNYKIKRVRQSFSARSVYKKYKRHKDSGIAALKKVLFDETQNEAYIALYSTEWTKAHILPPRSKVGKDLYEWEILRRIEDKDYFDCTTNTKWALSHPDPSVYSYARVLTGYGRSATLPFQFKFDQKTKNKAILAKEKLSQNTNEQLVSTCLMCYYWVSDHNEKIGKKTNLHFTCGDLYTHLQWLKQRLAEDQEFVTMLPRLKYSPHIVDLLYNFNLNPPMDVPGINTDLGMSLDWYIAPGFQKQLEVNLYNYLIAQKKKIAIDKSPQNSRFENFDIYSIIKKRK